MPSEATTQAIFAFAIVTLELYERLALRCARRFESDFSPGASDEIAFGFQLVEKVEGAFAKDFLVVVFAIAEQQGRYRVDE